MTMRVKPVIINNTAGKNPSAVKNSSVWIGTEKLFPAGPCPTSKGRLAGGVLWAHAVAQTVDNKDKARIDLPCVPSHEESWIRRPIRNCAVKASRADIENALSLARTMFPGVFDSRGRLRTLAAQTST